MLVYLVEDDVSIRELIGYALKSIGLDFCGFESGDEFFGALFSALDSEQAQKPALVLLDIMLPNDNGLDILKRLKASDKTAFLPVIMLTAKGSEIDKVSALDAGADDYVTKPFGVMELLSRIKALLRRSKAEAKDNSEGLVKVGDITIDLKRHEVRVGEKEISLTFKEFELLLYLMKNKGIALSREKIMEKVWGFDFQGESRTVDMHIKLIRQKLLSGGEKIKTIRGIGYKFSDE